MTKSEPQKLRIACLIVYFLLLGAFFGRVLFFTDTQKFLRAGKEAVKRDYTSDWVLDTGEPVDLKAISAGEFGGSFTVSKVLPESMLETDSIYLSTSNLRFTFFVDDIPIYSFDTRENLTGTGDGVSYHMIGLGTKDEGKTIRIEAQTVFVNGRGGRINEMQYGAEELYRYYVMRRNTFGHWLSILMIIFGVIILAFYIGMSRRSKIMRSLWALGLSAILFGIWSLCDTGVPQLLTGCTYAARELVYGLLHLAGFPMIWFVTRVTRLQSRVCLYLSFLTTLLCYGWLVISRYVFGRDLHTMVGVIYLSYALQLFLLVALLIANEYYCRQRNISSGLTYFYLGAALFASTSLADMIRYMIGRKTSLEHGSWFRCGLVLFFILMTFQIFAWWNSEKSSLERDRFINKLLQYVMDTENPESKIHKVLEYLCTELHADRAYIFEDMRDGTFDNTYEFCADGVTPEIDNLKGLPYDGVVDVWYREYEKGGHILIYDLEKYRAVSESMYEVLKPQGIHTLVTGPLVLSGERIGFFGVDNPPAEMMKEISEIIRLLMFFLSEMIGQRDSLKRLLDYSYRDAMTGAFNRRAIREFEKNDLDVSQLYGFVMCDINGLKEVNDHQGHDAGDQMITTVADCLTEVFGRKHVYRMGGDEFSVYSFEDTEDKFIRKIEEIRTLIGKRGVHVAIGYSYAEKGDPNIHARKVEADNRMYDEKRAFYRDGQDRRHNRMN